MISKENGSMDFLEKFTIGENINFLCLSPYYFCNSIVVHVSNNQHMVYGH